MSSRIRILAVSKRFAGEPVLTNISLDIAPGEVVTLIGPSGCACWPASKTATKASCSSMVCQPHPRATCSA